MTAHQIDGGKPAFVDLGVKGGPNCPAFAVKAWKTPSTPGHYCLMVFLNWLDDANPLNNLGQENLAIGVAHSPARFTFMLRNNGTERRTFRFETDAYRLPKLPTCGEVRRPTQEELSAIAVRPAAYRLTPALEAEVHAQHDQKANSLPEGWHVAINPAEPALDANEQRTIHVEITPPAGFGGRQPVNVRALHDGDVSSGGVTLIVVGS